MGIDAEVLLRVRGERPTEDQLTRWSWLLCEAIGAKHFFVKDGLPPQQYRAESERWHSAFNAHPRYADFQEASKRRDEASFKAFEEARTAIIRDIGQPPEERRRAIDLSRADFADEPEDGGQPGRVYYQDGETIYADEGEWLLRVSLWTRYYGIGYERGDLLTICAVAEWCEANIPNCSVWYGGDSSGVLAEPFGEAERARLRRHLYSSEGRNYYARGLFSEAGPRPKQCGLCISGEDRFTQFGCGGGGEFIAVECAGCGKSFETHDAGATWSERKDD